MLCFQHVISHNFVINVETVLCDFVLHKTKLSSVCDVWVPGVRRTMFPLRRFTTKPNETSSVGPLTWLVLIMCFNDRLASWKSHDLEGLCS